MVSIAATESGNHKPRVNEDVSGHSPWLANRRTLAHQVGR
jgi:hypothetical protein